MAKILQNNNMRFKTGLIICLIISNFLSAQKFTCKPVNSFSKDILDQKFKKYSLIELDVASIKNSMNSRSNAQHLNLVGEGINWDLSLTEFDMFKSDFYATIGTDRGLERSKDRSAIKTYKVLSSSKRTGLSCLTIADHFIYGFIEEAGVKNYIEPLRYLDPKAGFDQYIVYSEADVIKDSGIKCGSDELENAGHIGEEEINKQLNSNRASCILVDIAIACDKTIFDNKGGVSASEAFVTGVLNNVQTNYDNEFTTDIEFNISTIYVATSTSTDPWNAVNNINTHLDVHRSWANAGGYGGASYAVATAWTRKYTSGAIGLAWVGALCGSFRYNVCSDFGGSAGLLRCLQAHELGHNFNAIHDGAGSGFIMAPAVSNSTTWSALSQSAINSYVKTVGCVGICSGGEPPLPDFLGSPTTICPNGTVKFTDQSSGFPTSWTWTFPGGTPSTSTVQSPTVLYKTTGLYDVTLKVTNNFGSNTVTFQKYIEVLPLVLNSFTTFTIDRELTTFNDCQNADSYLWNFGDGSTSTEDAPMHTYTKDGTFTVELCATNTCGKVCKTQKVVIVTPVEANFIAETQDGCAALKVKYRNLSSINSTAFKWEFPGGVPSVSVEKEPLVTYNNVGVYDVKLTATNSKYTNTKVEKGFIRVDGIPHSDFDPQALIGNSIDFINKTVDTIRPWKYSYLWNFGDGKTSTEKNPTHVFPGTNKYDVCLITDNGCGKDTLCKVVEISGSLSASFDANNTKGCTPMTVDFKNNSTGAVKYKWSFQGGSPSTSESPNPTIIYNQAGTFDVSLIAYSATDSVVKNQKSFITVNTSPVSQFDMDITKLSVKFKNLSKLGSSFLWKFSDNTTSTEENPTHDFKAEGEYEVELTVKNECGENTTRKKIAIYLIPKVNFSADYTIICAGDYINFKDLSSIDTKEWNWQIEGGTPSTSTERNPKVLFDKAGVYSVKFTVKNSNGENSLTKTSYIHVKSPVFCPKHTGKRKKLEEGDADGDEIITPRTSNNELQNDIIISPNPGNGLFVLTLPSSMILPNSHISITDSNGTAVLFDKKPDGNNIKLDLSYLNSGIYYLKAEDSTKSYVKKIVVVH